MRRLLPVLLLAASCRTTAVYSVTLELPSAEVVAAVAEGGRMETRAGGAVLGRTLEVSGPRTRDRGGLVEVQLDLLNRTVGEKRFEYRFEWADADGMRIPSGSSHWTPVVVGGHETLPVSALAPRPGVGRCTLKVRLSRGAS